MRGNIGFGIRLPNSNISNAKQTLVPFSTSSNSGAGGGGHGRGRGSPLSSSRPFDFNGRASGKPDSGESNRAPRKPDSCESNRVLGKPDSSESKFDSPDSHVPSGSGLGHGRGKPVPPPSSGLPSFSSFMSSLKQPPVGRGQITGPVASQPANDSGPKKPIFFKREDIPDVLAGLGRGKPMKQPGPEDQVVEENRHLRARRTPDTAASKTVPESKPVLSREDGVHNARKILSQGDGGSSTSETVPENKPLLKWEKAVNNARKILSQGDKGSSTGRGRGGQRGGLGRGRGRGRGRFTPREREERGGWDQDTEDTYATGLYVGDNADGEKLAERLGPETMNQLTEGFEEFADTVLPSPLLDEYLEALDINCAIEFEPEYLMGEFDSNPDIDDKPPIPLRDALEKMKPFLMAYEGIQSQEEWEEIMEETMARVPLLKKIVDHYGGPDRVTAKKQQEELERVAKTLPQSAPSSVKQFTDRAVLSLQSNPGWGFDKKCQFMDKLVWEVSEHYK